MKKEIFQPDLLEVNSSNKLGALDAKDFKRTNIHYAFVVMQENKAHKFLLFFSSQSLATCLFLKFLTFVPFKSAGRNRNQLINPFVTVLPNLSLALSFTP